MQGGTSLPAGRYFTGPFAIIRWRRLLRLAGCTSRVGYADFHFESDETSLTNAQTMPDGTLTWFKLRVILCSLIEAPSERGAPEARLL